MKIGPFVIAALFLAGSTRVGHAQNPDTTVKGEMAPDSAILTPAIIDQGRKIFHGPGNCYACHGDKLEGGPIAPSLQGKSWRHIDGSHSAGWTRGWRAPPWSPIPAGSARLKS
jgi:mono/diheme cytochrome c family protein